MSYFITGLGFLVVDLPLRLAMDGPCIYPSLIIYATDIGQFDIMLMETICLKFFTVGRPTFLLIFMANLVLSIFLLVDPVIFSSSV